MESLAEAGSSYVHKEVQSWEKSVAKRPRLMPLHPGHLPLSGPWGPCQEGHPSVLTQWPRAWPVRVFVAAASMAAPSLVGYDGYNGDARSAAPSLDGYNGYIGEELSAAPSLYGFKWLHRRKT
eukprot:scaffold256050_cov21-Tisochrysis_lutea.AAC.1